MARPRLLYRKEVVPSGPKSEAEKSATFLAESGQFERFLEGNPNLANLSGFWPDWVTIWVNLDLI